MAAAKTIGGLVVRHLTVLDEPILALLRAPNVCVINTFGAEDVIHSRAVWVDTDGDDVLVNSVAGRVWVHDLDRNPTVTCTVVNLANPYEFASIEGKMIERTNEGAEDHIDLLARKYLGVDQYPFHSATEPRVLCRIRPDRILYMAPEDASLP